MIIVSEQRRQRRCCVLAYVQHGNPLPFISLLLCLRSTTGLSHHCQIRRCPWKPDNTTSKKKDNHHRAVLPRHGSRNGRHAGSGNSPRRRLGTTSGQKCLPRIARTIQCDFVLSLSNLCLPDLPQRHCVPIYTATAPALTLSSLNPFQPLLRHFKPPPERFELPAANRLNPLSACSIWIWPTLSNESSICRTVSEFESLQVL